MKALSGSTLTALASQRLGMAQLVDMDLVSFYWRVNTSGWDLAYEGNTYLGVQAAMGRIDVIEESPGEVKGLRFELPAIASADRAIALAEPVQGRPVLIRTAIFNLDTFAIIEAPVEWRGRLDTMTIAQGERSAVIQVTAEHVGIDLLRPSNWQYSKQHQLALHPGDLSLEYVVDQADKQIVFPAASYFRK